MPFIKAREGGKVIQIPDWYSWQMSYKDFKTFANEYTYHNGFYGLFSELEYYFFGHDCMDRNENYSKAIRLWNGFVTRNILVKNPPKEGDKLTIHTFGNTEEEYTFLKFYDAFRSVQVKDDTGRMFYYNVDRIKKLNGEPFELEFYIKWKRKTYGID
jgi:hypothetical protein